MSFPENLKNWEDKGTSFSTQSQQKKFYKKFSKDLLVQFQKLGIKTVSKEIGDIYDLFLHLFWYIDKKQVIYLRKHELRKKKGKKSPCATKEEFLSRYLHKELSLNILLCLKLLISENSEQENNEKGKEKEKEKEKENENEKDKEKENKKKFFYIKGLATFMVDHLVALTSKTLREKSMTNSEHTVTLLRMIFHRDMTFHKKHDKKSVPLVIHVLQILVSLCDNPEAVLELGNEKNLKRLIAISGVKELGGMFTFFVLRKILMKVGKELINSKNTNFFQENPDFLKHIISMIDPKGDWSFPWLLGLLTDLVELIGITVKIEKSDKILRIFEKNHGYRKLKEIAQRLLENGGGQELCSFLRLLKDLVIIGIPFSKTVTVTITDDNQNEKQTKKNNIETKLKKSISDIELEIKKKEKNKKKKNNKGEESDEEDELIKKKKKKNTKKQSSSSESEKDKQSDSDTNINTDTDTQKGSETEKDDQTEEQSGTETEKQNSDNDSTSLSYSNTEKNSDIQTESKSESNSENENNNKEKEGKSQEKEIKLEKEKKKQKKTEHKKEKEKEKVQTNEKEVKKGKKKPKEIKLEKEKTNNEKEDQKKPKKKQKKIIDFKPNEKVYDIILEISLSKKGIKICVETLITIIIEMLNAYRAHWRIIKKEKAIQKMFEMFFKLKPTVRESLLVAFQLLVEASFEEFSKGNNNNNNNDNNNNMQETEELVEKDKDILEMIRTFIGFMDNKKAPKGTNLILFTHINKMIQSRIEWGTFLQKGGILPIIISHLQLKTSGRENEKIIIQLLEFLSYFLPLSELNRKSFFQLGGYQQIHHGLLSDHLRWYSLNIFIQIVKIVEEKESLQIIKDLINLLKTTGEGSVLSIGVFKIRNDVLTALAIMGKFNPIVKNQFNRNGESESESEEANDGRHKEEGKLSLKEIYSQFDFSQPIDQKKTKKKKKKTENDDDDADDEEESHDQEKNKKKRATPEINLYRTYLFIDTILRTISIMIDNNLENKKYIDQKLLDFNHLLFNPLMKLQLFKSQYVGLIFHSLINLSTGCNWSKYPKYEIDYKFSNYSKVNQHLLSFPKSLILPTSANRDNNQKKVLDNKQKLNIQKTLIKNPISNLEIFTLNFQKNCLINNEGNTKSKNNSKNKNVKKNNRKNPMATNFVYIQYPQVINLIMQIIKYLFDKTGNESNSNKKPKKDEDGKEKSKKLNIKNEINLILQHLINLIKSNSGNSSQLNKSGFLELLLSEFKDAFLNQKHELHNFIVQLFEAISFTMVTPQSLKLYFSLIKETKSPINLLLALVKMCRKKFIPNNYIEFNYNNTYNGNQQTGEINLKNIIDQTFFQANGYSLSIWFNIKSFGNLQSNDIIKMMKLKLNADNHLQFSINKNGNINIKLKKDQIIELNFTNIKIISNQWYHLILTQKASSKGKKGSSQLLCYLNGILIEKKDFYYPVFNNNNKSSIKFGGWEKTQNNGNLIWQFTNPMIFSQQLTDEQIFILYTLGFNYDYYLGNKTLSGFLLHEEIINNPKYINFFHNHLALISNWKRQSTEFLKRKNIFSFIIRKSLIKIKLSKREIQENNSKPLTDQLIITNKYYNKIFENPNNCYCNYYRNHFFKQSLQSIGGVNCLLFLLAQSLNRMDDEYQYNSLHLIKHYVINQPPKLLIREKTVFQLLSLIFENENWKMTPKMFKLIFSFTGIKIIKYSSKVQKIELEGFFTNMPALFELLFNWKIWGGQSLEYQLNIFNIIIKLISKKYANHQLNISQLQKSQFLLKMFQFLKEHPTINYKIIQKIIKIFNILDQTTEGMLNILNFLIETQYLNFDQQENLDQKQDSNIDRIKKKISGKKTTILEFTNSISNDPIQQNRILFINYLSDIIKGNQTKQFVLDFILECDSENLVSILRHPSNSIRTSVLNLIRSCLFSIKFINKFQEKHVFNLIGNFLSYFEINNEILDFLFLLTKKCYQIVPIKILIANSTHFGFKAQVLDRLLDLFKNSNGVEKFKFIQNGLIDLLCAIILSETQDEKKLLNKSDLQKNINLNKLENEKVKGEKKKKKKAKKENEKENEKEGLGIVKKARLFLIDIGKFSIIFDRGIDKVFRQIVKSVNKLEKDLGSETIIYYQQSVLIGIFKTIEKTTKKLKDKLDQNRIFRDNVRDFAKFLYRIIIYWTIDCQKSTEKNIYNNFPTKKNTFFYNQIFNFFINLQKVEVFIFVKDILIKIILLFLLNKLQNNSIQILCINLLNDNTPLLDYILTKDRFAALLKYSLCSNILFYKEMKQKKKKMKSKENENEIINKEEIKFNNLVEELIKDIFERTKKKFLEKIFKKDFQNQIKKTQQQNKKIYKTWEKKTITRYNKFIRFLTVSALVYRKESNTEFLPPPPDLSQVQLNSIIEKYNKLIEKQKDNEKRNRLNKLNNNYKIIKLWQNIIKQMTNERAVWFKQPKLILYLKDPTEGPMRVRKRLKKKFLYNDDLINNFLKKFNFLNKKNDQKEIKKFNSQLIEENTNFKQISTNNFSNLIKIYNNQKKKKKGKKGEEKKDEEKNGEEKKAEKKGKKGEENDDNGFINYKELIKKVCNKDFNYFEIIKDIDKTTKKGKKKYIRFNIQICDGNSKSFENDNSNCQGEIIFGKQSFHLLFNDNKKYKAFNYILIREIYPQRYFLKDLALEIMLTNGQTLFLIFNNREQRDETFKILKAQDLPNISQLLGKHFDKFLPLRKCIQLWKTRKISNFQYLMWLNTLASRTYNDLNQYPIFPYLVSNYNDPELDFSNKNDFRNLRFLMGCLNSKRKERYLENYENLVKKNQENKEKEKKKEGGKKRGKKREIIPYHYPNFSSNYHTVLYYFMRIEPFYSKLTGIKKKKGNEDLFISIKNSYDQSSKLALNDVKELIPDYFYFPEMFININGFNFGKQNKHFINDVKLPKWANNDIRLFIKKQREILESEVVSQNLNYWIDHIFGYKLLGEIAKESVNIYHPNCYQKESEKESYEGEDNDEDESESESESESDGEGEGEKGENDKRKLKRKEREREREREMEMEKRVQKEEMRRRREIKVKGQIPVQLFQKSHPTRKGAGPRIKSVGVTVITEEMEETKDMWKKKLDNRLKKQIFTNPHELEYSEYSTFNGQIDKLVLLFEKNVILPLSKNQQILRLKHRDVMLNWSKYDSNLIISQYETNKIQFIKSNRFKRPIRHCILHNNGFNLIICSVGNSLVVYQPVITQNGIEDLVEKSVLFGHDQKITCLREMSEYQMIASGSKDGTCILWDTNKWKPITSLRNHEGSVSVIESSKISGDILTFTHNEKNDQNVLRLWNVNGFLLKTIKLENGDNGFVQSALFTYGVEGIARNVIILGMKNGLISFYDAFDLSFITNLKSQNKVPITALATSLNSKRLFSAEKDGLIHVWERKNTKK
ncbi:lysosomal-trafficking regulator [Anaeramoeba flamelloides]|uniref:Lysosomal-trafficking regulator n=1 Tax=Anaeramoeba flamelloides TaxID=1746091 RepID=A0AAV7Z7K5_9EUKA|nr:lysosomal-trafficking regulator [Anaeramoeba flamelloides]